ncbi:DoxX family protein [Streptomyces caniscabiei]|uniref:DoxX family protein n=1 Tax=Streptomyces caniscabiei TaxID=2746961 RepID=A0A927L5D6_9ACTN|nr:DoxX family protein [Streptomyces caniscabiei]MBD9725599.1 DoxX family protein [Streptomyces caniscabiei]MDX3510138.1 DoxX family protein [Streptomyces caniscabiei]MDX3720901.1 DoxX family protein [Streptomyces caniscabiei]WEO27755.1 DoxX family protein [Streptomyces caniscabiei]
MSETTAPAGRAASTAAPASTAVPGPTAVPAARTKATARGKGARISLRALQIALALFYGLASALPKLIAHPSAVESFDTLGWGSAGMYTIGLLELAGSVGLLIPVLAPLAAVSLSALMVGAFITQITAFDGEYAATPLILIVPLALIALIARVRRHDAAGLTRLVRGRRA